MKKNIPIALLILSTSCVSKSDETVFSDRRLTIMNNSNIEIVAMLSTDYPDTVNYKPDGCVALDETYYIPARTSKQLFLWGKTWDTYINRIPSKVAMLLLYDVDTAKYYYEKTQDCSLLKGKALNRINFNIDYLNANNWLIVYE